MDWLARLARPPDESKQVRIHVSSYEMKATTAVFLCMTALVGCNKRTSPPDNHDVSFFYKDISEDNKRKVKGLMMSHSQVGDEFMVSSHLLTDSVEYSFHFGDEKPTIKVDRITTIYKALENSQPPVERPSLILSKGLESFRNKIREDCGF